MAIEWSAHFNDPDEGRRQLGLCIRDDGTIGWYSHGHDGGEIDPDDLDKMREFVERAEQVEAEDE